MIFGECPNCDEPVVNLMPDVSPVFIKADCESCGKTYWLYATRMGGCLAYTEDGFAEEYHVDEATKQITKRTPAQ